MLAAVRVWMCLWSCCTHVGVLQGMAELSCALVGFKWHVCSVYISKLLEASVCNACS